jgi:hypothetical protein
LPWGSLLNLYAVYGLFAGDELYYVGASKNPRHRLRQHLSAARRGHTIPVCRRTREYVAAGIRPSIQVLETHSTAVAAVEREGLLTWLIRDYAGVDIANVFAGNMQAVSTIEKGLATKRRADVQERIVRSSRSCAISSNNTSGAKGVSWHAGKRRWRAYLNVIRDGKYKQISCGYHVTIDEAIAARADGERLAWGRK